MIEAVVAGSTGLVGSHILSTLITSTSTTKVSAYTRRDLPQQSPKLTPLLSADTHTWPSLFPRQSKPVVLFSGLGTTRAQAGSTDAQYKVDHDLNLELAKAAKEAGVKVYVLISTSGANTNSMMFYPKMKGQLEEDIKALEFEHTVILRPGLIVGDRTDSRPAEAAIRHIARAAGKFGDGMKDFWAQDADVIAKAAVHAGMQCLEGKKTEKGTWLVGQSDIIRLGRTEWN
ncbi:hypothetical protein EJ05DRAFT_474109, partial [Pseudovirgaria hyperparasitica]